MKKTLQILSILILALGFAVAPASAEATIVPTEVERVKDYYYFKIQGKPCTPTPTDGQAEFIYKNLSTKTQNINVTIEVTVGGYHSYWPFERTLNPGEEWSSFAPEDLGVTVYFELWIDDSLAFNGTIWVPPPL